jgi:hypothetical protein
VCKREGDRPMYEGNKKSMRKKSEVHTNPAVHGAPEHVKLVIMNKDNNYKTRQTHTLEKDTMPCSKLYSKSYMNVPTYR